MSLVIDLTSDDESDLEVVESVSPIDITRKTSTQLDLLSDSIDLAGETSTLPDLLPNSIDLTSETSTLPDLLPDSELASPLENAMEISAHKWKEEFLECVRSPRLGAPLGYFKREISETNPGLFIHGAGKIGLPLSTRDAEAIIGICNKNATNDDMASKGTAIDDAVNDVTVDTTFTGTDNKNVWELLPDEFLIRNPDWENTISMAINQAIQGLSILTLKNNIRAVLQKLVLFEKGQSLTYPPRQVENTSLVGTLAMYLPSEHQGGEVILTHFGAKEELDTSKCSDFQSSMLAWFAYTSTRICEVTSGFQCVLIYDLHYIQQAPTTSPRAIESVPQRLANLVKVWTDPKGDKICPKPLVCMLDDYYEFNHDFSLDDLECPDKILLSALQAICEQTETEIFLANIRKEETGQYHEESEPDDLNQDGDFFFPEYEPIECRSLTSQIPKILDGEERYYLTCLCGLNGIELGREITISEENLIADEPFAGDPDKTEHNHIENSIKNIWLGAVFVLLPKSSRTKFFLDNGLSSFEPLLNNTHTSESTSISSPQNLFNKRKARQESPENSPAKKIRSGPSLG